MQLHADGTQQFLGSAAVTDFTPNGLALAANGHLIFANIGSDGGIWIICPDQATDNSPSPLLLEIEGAPVGPVNFVLMAPDNSLWFSVLSTGHDLPLSQSRADGYVARITDGKAEVMADGLTTANEFRFDVARGAFYVNETFARRTTRFDLAADGTIHNPKIFASYERGTFPDGLALDVNGNLWVTSIVSNRILVVSPSGFVQPVYEDSNPERVGAVEVALQQEKLGRDLIYSDDGTNLQNPTSIAFCGPDLTTAVIGSLTGTTLRTFESPVAGMPLQHWNSRR